MIYIYSGVCAKNRDGGLIVEKSAKKCKKLCEKVLAISINIIKESLKRERIYGNQPFRWSWWSRYGI